MAKLKDKKKIIIMPWTYTKVQHLITTVVQHKAFKYGYHATLGGGVLNNTNSNKDTDLYFLPLLGKGHKKDINGLIGALKDVFKSSPKAIGDPQYQEAELPCVWKAKFYHSNYYTELNPNPNTFRRIDVFIYGDGTEVVEDGFKPLKSDVTEILYSDLLNKSTEEKISDAVQQHVSTNKSISEKYYLTPYTSNPYKGVMSGSSVKPSSGADSFSKLSKQYEYYVKNFGIWDTETKLSGLGVQKKVVSEPEETFDIGVIGKDK